MNDEKNLRPLDGGISGYGWRIGLGLVAGGQGMIFGLGYNLALDAGEAPAYGSVPYVIIHGVLAFSALVVMMFLGGPLFRELWIAIRKGQLQVEALFSLSLIGAMTLSVHSTLTGAGSIYYEIVAIVLVIYAFGKQLTAQKRSDAMRVFEAMEQQYERVFVLREKERVSVSVVELNPGDIISVQTDEWVAVDGVVREGEAYLLETAVTGETIPVLKTVGDEVVSGSKLVDGRLLVAVTTSYGQRYIDRILNQIRLSDRRVPRLQRHADRLMKFFVPYIVAMASVPVGFGIIGFLSLDEVILRSMSVLLIACPCALGVALPLGMWGGVYRLSEKGVFVRDGQFLDRLSDVDQVVFDKTGTLSESDFGILRWAWIDGQKSVGEDWVREAVATLESGVHHPIARAFSSLPKGNRKLTERRLLSHFGLEGVVDGRRIRVQGCDLHELPKPDGKIEPNPMIIQGSGKKGLRIEIDEQTIGWIELGEIWREDSFAILRQLQSEGFDVLILTGDPHQTPLREAFEIPIRWGVRSEEKQKLIQEFSAAGRTVLMIGDGINDVEAMQAASVSMAIGKDNVFVQKVAQASMTGDSLRVLPWTIRFARKLRKMIQRNFLYALSYNFVGSVFAVMGWLHPVVAALIMVASSLFVTFNTMRQLGRL